MEKLCKKLKLDTETKIPNKNSKTPTQNSDPNKLQIGKVTIKIRAKTRQKLVPSL